MNRIKASDDLLALPEYATCVRIKGYNGKVSVYTAVNARDAANVLINISPGVNRSRHLELAAQHEALVIQHQLYYNKALDKAAQALFGRPWRITDFKVSCIGRDEFSEEHKAELRYHGYSATKHATLAYAHKAASTSRRIK